jgi:hypothetical protein
MKRDAVYYVMPLGEIWLVRAIGSSAEAYPTFEDALAAAERLAARGARVRVLSRASGHDPLSPGLASAAAPVSTTSVTSVSTVTTVSSVKDADQDSDPVRRAAS